LGVVNADFIGLEVDSLEVVALKIVTWEMVAMEFYLLLGILLVLWNVTWEIVA